MMSVLTKIQKQFPAVLKVIDSDESISISVTEKDTSSARKKDPSSCAMAKACCRQEKLDGAIIGLSYSYLIKGALAVRFRTPNTVQREITSFDRHHDFATGANYRLSRVCDSQKLGHQWGRKSTRKGTKASSLQYTHTHFTANIR